MPADQIWPVERINRQDTYALRQQVLRPHQSVAEVGFAGDDDPETGHYAVFSDGADAQRIVGVVTVLRQFPAARTADDPDRWWRLRGMATAEDWRGRGVGSALVAAAVAHVAAHHGTVLWCYARISAVAFYRTAGFVTTGEVWDEPALGPHIAMWRTVARFP
jgi:GNAT superfamily N-acetyltransferase